MNNEMTLFQLPWITKQVPSLEAKSELDNGQSKVE